jgi:hypothetical protein
VEELEEDKDQADSAPVLHAANLSSKRCASWSYTYDLTLLVGALIVRLKDSQEIGCVHIRCKQLVSASKLNLDDANSS